VEPVLVHLHPDFQQPLEDLFEIWNNTQQSWNFVGLRPRRDAERSLLTPGAISEDEASLIASEMRSSGGFPSERGIIIFTEKRLYADEYYQLFVGGREADEDPPRIAILSLDFLRKAYQQRPGKPVLFRAIISNILFSLGVDCGLDGHGGEIRGCIMDFCAFLPDIEVGLTNGPRFCTECSAALDRSGRLDLPNIVNATLRKPDVAYYDETVSESIILRGERYKRVKKGFDYDVALSFAGEDRHYAEQLAVALRSHGLAVFYDQFNEAELWGKNLHAYLNELYSLRAKYCVVFLSANYQRSKWTRLELEAALSRDLESDKEFVLPIRLDDSHISMIPSTRAYLDWRKYRVEQIAEMLKRKLEM
jgi:predicted Zn-dependent protease